MKVLRPEHCIGRVEQGRGKVKREKMQSELTVHGLWSTLESTLSKTFLHQQPMFTSWFLQCAIATNNDQPVFR